MTKSKPHTVRSYGDKQEPLKGHSPLSLRQNRKRRGQRKRQEEREKKRSGRVRGIGEKKEGRKASAAMDAALCKQQKL